MSYSGVVFLVLKTTKSSYVFSNLDSYFIACVMIRALKLLEVLKESQIDTMCSEMASLFFGQSKVN